MNTLKVLSLAAMIGLAGAADAQTAGGPAQASPGAMPSQTPLTSSGTPRNTTPAATAPSTADTTGAATPATPGATGANKPARPSRTTTRRRAPTHSVKAPASTTDQGSTSSQ